MNCCMNKTMFIAIILTLFGCNEKIELYGKLTEKDANKIMSELLLNNISTEKKIDKKRNVSILIYPDSIPLAVKILNEAGLPNKSLETIGDIFNKDSLVSSPLEEKARYLYALSQELEFTLSQIDGVIIARVHLVLPYRISPGEDILPSSVAVFIKHKQILDPDIIRPRIKRFVYQAIPGIESTEKIEIVFVSHTKNDIKLNEKKNKYSQYKILNVFVTTVIVLLSLTIIIMVFRKKNTL